MMNTARKKTLALGAGVLLLSGASLATLTVPVAKVWAADPAAPAPTDQDMQRWMQQRQMGYGGGSMGPGTMGMGGRGMGMMGGMGMMDDDMMGGHHGMMMGRGLIAMLDLTDEQNAKISKIEDELRKKNWDLMGKSMDEATKLRDLYNAPKRDPKAIGAVYGNLFNLKRQMIENTIDARNRMETELTDKQREQLKQIRRDMMRPGPGMGMGPGMMRDGIPAR